MRGPAPYRAADASPVVPPVVSGIPEGAPRGGLRVPPAPGAVRASPVSAGLIRRPVRRLSASAARATTWAEGRVPESQWETEVRS